MYVKHYIIQCVGKSSQMFTVEIWERDYTGGIEQIPAADSPIIQSLLAQSDDAFDPILASTLNIKTYISGYSGSVPDLQTNDDRKYWVRLICGPNPADGKAYLLLRNHQGGIGIRKSTLIVLVNGTQVLTLSGAGTEDGQLVVNAGDIVTIQQSPLGGATMGSTWGMDIDDSTTTLFSDSTSTPSTPTSFEYSFIAAAATTYRAKAHVAGGVSYPDAPITNLWQGFILTDNAQVPFTSGFLPLAFTCVDGLAMLKSIPYEPTNSDINIPETLLRVVLNCLGKIELPEGFYLNVCLSVFANGMMNRGDGTQYEPFGQTYYYPRNFIDRAPISVPGIVSTSSYMSCYDVLTRILSSFGCQIKQAGSEYYVTSINEQAGSNIYFTKYDQDESLVSSGIYDFKKTIVPWSDLAEVYFVNATQNKTLRKGFPDIQLKCASAFAPQCIDNGDFASITSGIPTNWTFDGGLSGGTITVVTNSDGQSYVELYVGGAGGIVQFQPNSVAKVERGDVINLSFLSEGDAGVEEMPVFIEFKIVDGDDEWTFGTDNIWKLNYGSYNPYTSGKIGYPRVSTSATTLPCPVSGTLSIQFELYTGYTVGHWFLYNVTMTLSNPYQYRLISNQTSNSSYQKVFELPIGGPCDYDKRNQIASLLSSTGSPLTGWYRYGRTENYSNLLALVYQQYFNIISKPSINVNGDIRRLFDHNKSALTPINCFSILDAPGNLSISGKSYQQGNANIDYGKDELQATLLEISNTDIAVVARDRIILKQ